MSRFRQLLDASTIHQKPFLMVPPGEVQAIADSLTVDDIPDLIAVMDGNYDQWDELQKAERTEDRSIDDEIDECYFYSQKIDSIVEAVKQLPASAFFSGMRSPHQFTRTKVASAIARLATADDLPELRDLANHAADASTRDRLGAAITRLELRPAPGPPSGRTGIFWWILAAIVFLYLLVFSVMIALVPQPSNPAG
jgi:hypothetical protein